MRRRYILKNAYNHPQKTPLGSTKLRGDIFMAIAKVLSDSPLTLTPPPGGEEKQGRNSWQLVLKNIYHYQMILS
jgi:hypothetical protein